MYNYKIMTDTTTDLPPQLMNELGLTPVPLEFTIGGQNYLDGGMDAKKFYALLREGIMATTGQVTVARFFEYFEPVLQAGKDIYYIAFSSGLSGTYSSAVVAAKELGAKYPERKILVTDSLCASMGEGLLVYYAIQRQREGMTIDEVHNWVEEHKLHLCHWFTVGDLNHLKRGGRVSSATALLGTMLGIKPVLHVDDEGHLIPVSKVRGRKQSMESLFDHMVQTVEAPEQQIIFISHGDCEEEARWLGAMVKEKLKVQDVVYNHVGTVIGSHSGPGTIALFFLGRHRS